MKRFVAFGALCNGRGTLGALCMLVFTALLALRPDASTAAPNQEHASYELRFQSPETALATLRPLLDDSARLSGADGRLFVVAAPADQAIVRRVLGELDRPAAQYLVTLHAGVSRSFADSLIADTPAQRYATGARTTETNTSLRVTSGRPAFVESGQVLRAITRFYATRRGAGFGTSEVRLTQGFAVSVDARGEMVEVRIQPFAAVPGRAQAVEPELSNADTTVIVPLDRWTLVGSGLPGEPAHARTYDLTGSLRESNTLIRVTRLDD